MVFREKRLFHKNEYTKEIRASTTLLVCSRKKILNRQKGSEKKLYECIYFIFPVETNTQKSTKQAMCGAKRERKEIQ